MKGKLLFMYGTQCLIEVKVCVKLFESPPIHGRVIAQRRIYYVKIKVPLALNKIMMVQLWFIYAAHCLLKLKICAKLFENPPTYGYSPDKKMGQMNGWTDGWTK